MRKQKLKTYLPLLPHVGSLSLVDLLVVFAPGTGLKEVGQDFQSLRLTREGKASMTSVLGHLLPHSPGDDFSLDDTQSSADSDCGVSLEVLLVFG